MPLREFQDILNSELGDDEDDADLANQLRSAARMLLERQFLHGDSRGAQRLAYEAITARLPYFDKLFDALGYKLISRPEFWCVGILPMSYPGAVGNSVSLQEMLFLMGLFGVYEERFKEAALGDYSRAEARLQEVWDFTSQRTGRAIPARSVCRSLMQDAQRLGLIQLGEELQDDQVIHILPSIRLVVPEDALVRLTHWGLQEAERHTSGQPVTPADALPDTIDAEDAS